MISSYCANVKHGAALAYHGLEAIQPGLGRGVVQVGAGATVAAAGLGAFCSRTVVCYALDRGLSCGNFFTIPVAAEFLMMFGGAGTITLGINNISRQAIGDRTASIVQAMRRLGILTGRADLGDRTQRAIKFASDVHEGYNAGSQLVSSLSSGYNYASNWWYGQPTAAVPAAEPAALANPVVAVANPAALSPVLASESPAPALASPAAADATPASPPSPVPASVSAEDKKSV